jgi:hypothetical protein
MAKTTKMMVPMVRGDDGELSFPEGMVPGLTRQQSKDAHGTQIHSLQAMEMLILSGYLTTKQMIQMLETLAKYQFTPAAHRPKATEEKSVEEWLKEIDGG